MPVCLYLTARTYYAARLVKPLTALQEHEPDLHSSPQTVHAFRFHARPMEPTHRAAGVFLGPKKYKSKDNTGWVINRCFGNQDLLATSVNSFKQLKFLQTKPTAENPYLKPRVSEKLYTLKENETLNIC